MVGILPSHYSTTISVLMSALVVLLTQLQITARHASCRAHHAKIPQLTVLIAPMDISLSVMELADN
jgi:hypothetical protein